MGKRLCAALLAFVALNFMLATAAELPAFKFSGSGSGNTPQFRVDGPWLIDWRALSEFPRATTIEFRLLDADSGQIVGIINQAEGGARGLKLIEQTGAFRIAVSAEGVDWAVDVIQVSAERGAQLKQQAGREPTLAQRSAQAARLLPAGSFAGWHAPDDSTMFIAVEGGGGWRLSFSPPCEGLSVARGITFVTPVSGDLKHYNSIMLDDGDRCYFDRVDPTGWTD